MPPSSWIARLLMTSLTFMFDWVPDPVCQTRSGKWSSSFPPMTSSAARLMASVRGVPSRPAAWLALAAAFFTCPSAW